MPPILSQPRLSPSPPQWWGLLALAAILGVLGCAPLSGEDVGQAAQAVCTSTTLSASPQGAAPGATVTWTANAGCGTGDTPQYEFWMLQGGTSSLVQPYGASNTYAWDTTGLAGGTYAFQVWVKNAGSSASWEAYLDTTYTLSGGPAACTGGALAASPPSPSSPGTSITLTAGATCGGTAQYQFLLFGAGGWSVVQPYGASDTYTWNTTGLAVGTYTFEVWAKNQGSEATYETYQDVTYTLSGGSAPCTGGALSYNPPTSAAPGTTVTVSGSATCGGTAQYQFLMLQPDSSYAVVQPYGASSTYAWNTTGLAVGTYEFQVWMKNAGSGAEWETYYNLPYNLSGTGAACTGGAMSYTPSSSASPGTIVTVTGSATCGGTAQYQFLMLQADSSYAIVQPYGPSNTYAWNTTGLAGGVYELQVWVKNAGSSAEWETYYDLPYTLTGGPPVCASATLSMSPPGPQTPLGTMVTVTAFASLCASPEYEFWMQVAGGSYSMVQPYGPSPTFAWNTSGLDDGAYGFVVWARNQGSTAQYETSTDTTYQLGVPCSSVAMSITPPSPWAAGTQVTVTAQATCPGTPEYELDIGNGLLVEPYGPTHTWVWDTTNVPAGGYGIGVDVRNQGSTYPSEATQGGVGTVYTPSSTCTQLTLSVISPSNATAFICGSATIGSTVTMQAVADCYGEYEFWVMPPGATSYYLAQPYGSPNGGTFVWDTTGLTVQGFYQIQAWVRLPGSTNSWDAYAEPPDNHGFGLWKVAAPTRPVDTSASCVRMSDGTVRCWDGTNFNLVPGLTNVTAISGDCALVAGGTVGCGWSATTPPTTVPGLSGVTQIAAGIFFPGGAFTCALLSGGTVECWGSNSNGQLGNGTTTDSSTPVTVTGLSNVAQLPTNLGDAHSCALLTDGTARCWGSNQYGQLGDGSTTDRSTPVAVMGLTAAAQLTLGLGQSYAIRSDQSVSSWGYDAGVTAVPFAAGFGAVEIEVYGNGSGNCILRPNADIVCGSDNSDTTVLVSGNGKEIGELSLGLDGSIWESGFGRIPPPTNAAIGFSPASPAPVGTSVTLTPASTHYGPVEYQLYVSAPGSGGTYSLVQDWSQSSTYTWSTTGLSAGVYNWQIRAVDVVGVGTVDIQTMLPYTLE